tara:strand:- start:26582 stop:28294 length:1713 start_codon:yes stop_codon:yes gene_type:complete
MHLNDALKKESRIQFVCNHHEQACAVAAEGYFRASGQLAVVNVTSGPGGTNAITGVLGQWLDSAPALYLSGQVKFETTIASDPDNPLRQLGDQEINIVDIVKPITKYAKMILSPEEIGIELDKAIGIATSGRPGPVWLDIPADVQGAMIDETSLPTGPSIDKESTLDMAQLSEVVDELQKAERPLFVAGHGIRLSKSESLFLELVEQLKIPVVTTFNGMDLMASDSDYFVGRIGTLGSRAGNFALQNADLVICLGTRNNIRQVSYDWDSYARFAKVVVVDIDQAELNKNTIASDLRVHTDIGVFLGQTRKALPADFSVKGEWLEWCTERKAKYPVVLDEYRKPNESAVHPYPFVESLTEELADDATVVAGNGSACVVLFQAAIVKSKQRIFWNSGCAAMGYALPASIGAAFSHKGDIICLTGDGSIQLNLQELQTIKKYNLPIKIFLLCNGGYQSIRQTQAAFFDSDFIGCDEESGVSFPDVSKLADLYDMKYIKVDSTVTMKETIRTALSEEGSLICEVVLDEEYVFSPKLSSQRMPDGSMLSKPLEDLSPLLDRDEFDSNMIFKEESK